MEPFSIVTGVLGMASAIDQAQKVMRKLRELRNAHSEVVEVAEQVSELHDILARVSELVARGREASLPKDDSESSDSSRSQFWQPEAIETLHALGRRAAAQLESLNTLIPDSDNLQKSGSQKLAVMLRIKDEQWTWTKNRGKVQKIQTDLGRLQINILSSLSIISSSTGLQLVSSHDSVTNILQQFNSLQIQKSTHSSPEPGPSDLTADSEDQDEPDLAELSLSHTIDSSELSEKSSIAQPVTTLPDGTELVPTSSEPQQRTDRIAVLAQPRNKCAPFCSCRCHKQTHLTSWRYRNQLQGRIFVASNGMLFGFNACTEKSCRRNTQKTLKFSYMPPSWLSKRNLQLSYLSDPTYGPEISVSLPRTVGWDAPIWKHAISGNLDAIRDMLDKGQASAEDVNLLGGSLLHYAMDRQHFDIVKLLIERGAAKDSLGDAGAAPTKKAWQYYLSGILTEEQERFIVETFDADYIQAQQFTILHKTVLGLAKLDLTALLQASTADMDTTDAEGRTPLSWAAAQVDSTGVQTLLSSGADANVRDIYQRTPLHYVHAAESAQLLINAGADINAKEEKGGTALHKVCEPPGNLSVLSILLNCGINVHDRDLFGDEAADCAVYNGYEDCAMALLQHVGIGNYDPLRLRKLLCATVLFDRRGVLRYLQNHGDIGMNLSDLFLDSIAGSEIERALEKWFQDTRSNASEFEKHHEQMFDYVEKEARVFTERHDLNDVEAEDLSDDDDDGNDVFLDAHEYLDTIT